MNRALVATALTFAATAAFAAGNTATATANAKVKIRKAITFTKTADLDFGGIVISASGTAADTAVLSPANVLTAPGTNGTIVGTFNTTAAAAFNVTGTKNATYAVTLPGGSTSLAGSNGGTLNVTSFTSASGSGTNTLSGTGTDTLAVGATLTVPQTTTDGDYTGTFSVTVAYN